MARFKNKQDYEIRFNLGGPRGQLIVVGPHAEFDVEDRHAVAVTAARLPVDQIEGPPVASAEDEIPKDPIGRLWRERAHGARADAIAAGRRAKEFEDQLGAAHERAEDNHQRADRAEAALEQAKQFVASVRGKLGLGPEDSVGDRIDSLLATEVAHRAHVELETATAPSTAAAQSVVAEAPTGAPARGGSKPR